VCIKKAKIKLKNKTKNKNQQHHVLKHTRQFKASVAADGLEAIRRLAL
jgi:hypothetical protein